MPLTLVQQDDSVIDRRIGILLRAGMLISAFVIFAGGALFLLHYGFAHVSFREFRGVPANLSSPLHIVLTAFRGDDLAIVQLGLLLLIATPIARVVFAVFAFAAERDYLYVAISAAVLAVLIYSVAFHGK